MKNRLKDGFEDYAAGLKGEEFSFGAGDIDLDPDPIAGTTGDKDLAVLLDALAKGLHDLSKSLKVVSNALDVVIGDLKGASK